MTKCKKDLFHLGGRATVCEVTHKGKYIGEVVYDETCKDYESYCLLADFGHDGMDTKEDAIADVKEMHEERIAGLRDTIREAKKILLKFGEKL